MLRMSHHFNPELRGFHAVYRENETNHCPGCGRSQWHIGRQLAECAYCSTALPLDASFTKNDAAPTIFERGKKHGVFRRAKERMHPRRGWRGQ